MWQAFFIGIAGGLLLSLPIAWAWSRRTAEKVRRLEQRARTAERLAELGTMTSGLAHEIKNPLSTVGLNVQLVQEDLAELKQAILNAEAASGSRHGEQIDRVKRRVDTLHRESQRLREILEDFLRFAGRVELDLQPTDLNQLTLEMTDFFQPQADELNIRLHCDLVPGITMARVDATLLKQALLNLLLNACQAMMQAREKNLPHGGADVLIVRTTRDTGSQSSDATCAIQVADTGPGLAPDAADKIFQPYFSTKRGGTGLGLPTSRRIVEEHGGTLTVHNAPGQGAKFTIRLPAFDPSTASPEVG